MNKVIKRILTISGAVLGTSIIVLGGYVTYVLLSYNRIGNKILEVDRHSKLEKVETSTIYKALSYNIGFGAYSQDYTFFMDTGYDDDGNETVGYYSKAKSRKAVEFNIAGSINACLENESDFYMIQEVDVDSTRSYHINQDKLLSEKFNEYDHSFATNFHTAFLPYPLYDMHGIVHGGLSTLSRFQINESIRKEYTITSSLSKFFDLDRCFCVNSISVENGKTLYIVNSHMSAYDTGGEIRRQQVKELNDFLSEKKENGDYVVIGGDFNHDILANNPDFDYTNEDGHRPFDMTKKSPDWFANYFDEDKKSPLIEGYRVIASDNEPTCRNNDIEYDPAETFVCCIDGFIVSDNIEVVSHKNISTSYKGDMSEKELKKIGYKGFDGFAFSDHNPTQLEFKLK